MPLRPLRCDHCGSTRLKYVRVGVDDEVAVCGMCHGVTEFSEDITDDRASEELVTHLERLRLRRPALEEGSESTARPRRKRGSSVLMWMMVVLAAIAAFGLLAGREMLARPVDTPDRIDADRALRERARGPRVERVEAEPEQVPEAPVPEAPVPEEPLPD